MTFSGLFRRSPARLLGLILLLALLLRLVSLGERSMWYDEAFAVLFADQGVEAMLYGTLTPVAGGASDIHPLLYYTLLDAWMEVFGRTPFAVRLLSVVLGLATIFFVYLLGRDLFDRRVGLAAAFVATLAPFHVQYAQEARMYSLLAFLLLAATWCFVRGSREPALVSLGRWRRFAANWGWWLAFGVLAALAMYTQQLAAFYLAALGALPLFTRSRRQLIGVAVGTVVALVVYLPWLVNLPGQLSKVGAYYWIPVPHPVRLLVSLRAFLTVGLDLPPSLMVASFVGALSLAALLFMQVALVLRRPRRADRRALWLVVWLFAGPVLLMWVVSQLRPVYLERALLPSALMLYLLLGWLFVRGGLPRPVAAVLGVIGVGLVGLGLYTQYTWDRFPNSPFEDALAAIESDLQPGDVIIHQNKLSALPMIYYRPDLPQRYLADVPGSPEDTLALPTQQALGLLADACVPAAARDAQRVWLVVFTDLLAQAEATGRADILAAFNWLDAHYQRVDTRVLNDLEVVLYASPDDIPRDAGCPA